ncbi:hypothetical protein DL765_003423 [Monosporascus sp. GIB2]|nr:hypothetical protein DL765_003423 [Monosporascus sp. GIB2]
MLFLELLAAAGLAAAPARATPVALRQTEQAFHIPFINAYVPSRAPGNTPYCSIRFSLTDMSTSTSTICNAQHGPCVLPSQDPVPAEKPLDAEHPALCDDPSFSFYLDVYESVSNYSLAISRTVDDDEKFGISEFINSDNFPDSWGMTCGESGICNAWAGSRTLPIVIPFI